MKKKLLPLALAAAAGFTGVTAQAQMVQNANGTGQLLMYPIYTANGGNDTYISVANTTNTYKAVKVRFLDAMNSQDSLDFHLYLSPYDHWSGVVTKDGEGAVLKTGDTSCTVPNSLAAAKPGEVGATVQMRTSKYATGGAEADKINNGADRTLEGHVEIIEMGVIDATPADIGSSADQAAANAAAAKIRTAIKHVAGVPGKCADLETAWKTGGEFYYDDPEEAPGDFTDSDLQLDPPTGGLYGYGVIINVPDGSAAMFDAVAVDGFMANSYHPTPGDDEPGTDDGVDTAAFLNDAGAYVTYDLSAAAAVTDAASVAAGSVSLRHIDLQRGVTGSRLAGGGNGATADGTTGGAVHADGSKETLSALLTRKSVANDYVLEAGLNAATDWVITFPTKRDFVNLNSDNSAATDNAESPFSSVWDHDKTESCDAIEITYYDREEGEKTITEAVDFSPAPVTTPDVTSLCTEVNIVNFNSKDALGGSSRITKDITLDPGFENGWAVIEFNTAAQSLEDPTTVVEGMPVIGFAIQKYVNNSATANGALANYAGSIGHHYTIETGTP